VEFLDRPMFRSAWSVAVADPRGGGRVRAHADRWADAPRPAGQSCGQARCCRGPRRRLATGWTPSGPAMRLRSGRSLGRRCWSPSRCTRRRAGPSPRGSRNSSGTRGP